MIRKKVFLTCVLSMLLAFIFGMLSPILVVADENAETLENSLESVTDKEVIDSGETVEFTPVSYRYTEDETHVVMIDLIDEKNALLRAIERSGAASWELARVNAAYMLSTEYNRLWIFVEDELFAVFSIQEDKSLVDITPVPDDTVEDPTEEPTEEDMNTILLPVVSGIVGLAGAGVLYLLFSGRLDKLGKAFNEMLSWFTKKKEELETEEIDLKKFKEDLTAAVCSNEEVKALLQQAYENNKEQYIAFKQVIADTVKTSVEMVGEMKASFDSRAEEIQKQYKQIREILIKMAAGMSELVRQGIADDIVKSLADKETKKKG